MIAESKGSALSWTISYISLEIIPAGRPFFGFSVHYKTHMRRQSQTIAEDLTIFIKILHNTNLWDLLLTKGQSAVGILLEYYFQPGLDCTASDGQVLVVQTCLDRCLPPPV